jgi:hypothetical protein
MFAAVYRPAFFRVPRPARHATAVEPRRALYIAAATCAALLTMSPRVSAADAPAYQLGGYVEAFYQWNTNRPGNDITHARGFDNRHNTFTLANVSLSAQFDYKNLLGNIALQIGHTPATYYAAEPARDGAPASNASNAELWRYVQQANVGYRFPIGRGLALSAGIFLSPIGPETIPIKDTWNWSRSNLFFGLPFYHTGAKLSYPVSDTWTANLLVLNGWNSVVDNNSGKSMAAQLLHKSARAEASVLYFGGVERSAGGREGEPWRHLLDAYATVDVTDRVSLMVQGNVGFENNNLGTSHWAAGALYARIRLLKELALAARADAFYEQPATAGSATASPIFWPVRWVSSRTVTLDYRPFERISLRLEYRNDVAAGNLYFAGSVGRDATGTYLPNQRFQNTVTTGLVAWF